MPRQHTTPTAASAFRFVLVLGLVNLFADTTYEGGASINGQFLGSLGASAAAVSVIAGVGEFLGYTLRSVSGYLADKTGKYWPLTFAGYAVNLLAVPAMALAGSWQMAGAFVLWSAWAEPSANRPAGPRRRMRRDSPRRTGST